MTKQFYYTDFQTPIGNIKIAASSKGVCYIELVSMTNDSFENQFTKLFGVHPVKHNTYCKEIETSLTQYFSGALKEFKLPIDLIIGTDFQKKVWKCLKTVPFGNIKTYKWVAEKIDMPKACRAVGNANGQNPIPIIIPCHRIVCSDGKLGGFSSGIDIKKKLLALEKIKGYS